MLQSVTADVKPNTKSASTTVCVECTMSTKFVCVECDCPYCERCFSTVHSAGVVLKQHKLNHCDAVSTTIGKPLGLCNSHRKKILYYCQTCSLPICQKCVATSHSKHETKDLLKIVSLCESFDGQWFFICSEFPLSVERKSQSGRTVEGAKGCSWIDWGVQIGKSIKVHFKI